jgi:DNA-binding NarL/FixJ family response regulator
MVEEDRQTSRTSEEIVDLGEQLAQLVAELGTGERDASSPASGGGDWVLFLGEATAFHAPFCPALEARGIEVVIGTSLADAVDATRKRPPSCIVCDADYHDGVGLELASALRAHVELLDVPLACISSDADRRVAALQLGADVAMSTAIDADVAAAQVAALLRLAGRLEEGLEQRTPPAHGISGHTAIAPLTTLLTALGVERRSGVVELVSDEGIAHLEIVDGRAIAGAISGERADPLATLRTMLGWVDARFAFTALPLHGDADASGELLTLCAEALRLQDEETREPGSSSEHRGLLARTA